MIDTVSLTHAIMPLAERHLLDIGATHPKGRTCWTINPRDGEALPSLTFQRQPDGVQRLTARQSLPRLRHGHNAILQRSQTDIFAELGLMADAIYRRTGIVFNPLTANVTGVHFTRDLSIGRELITPTLTRLEPRRLPRYTWLRLDHGIEYKQRSSSVQIYSKYHEMQKQVMRGTIPKEHQSDALEAADGVLRVECKQTLASLDRLQRRASKTRIAKDVLTPELSNFVIDTFLEKLQFNDALNNAESNRPLDRLIEVHGALRAVRLIGFLLMIESYGSDFWKLDHLDYKRRSYFDNLKLCRDAGVWNAKTL